MRAFGETQSWLPEDAVDPSAAVAALIVQERGFPEAA